MTTPNDALDSATMAQSIETDAREERHANTGTRDCVNSLLKVKNVRTVDAHSNTLKHIGIQGMQMN